MHQLTLGARGAERHDPSLKTRGHLQKCAHQFAKKCKFNTFALLTKSFNHLAAASFSVIRGALPPQIGKFSGKIA